MSYWRWPDGLPFVGIGYVSRANATQMLILSAILVLWLYFHAAQMSLQSHHNPK
jgi:hypothetical protein